jgi:hypothetical protein
MRLIALVGHNVPGARILIALLSLTCPCFCQMVYSVSVYTDAQVGNDGNTLFATSTTVDSSTGCGAHGQYSTTATLIGPTGAQASVTGGMVGNTSMDINGLEGDYTAFGTVQLYCGCFGHWVGGGGLTVPISVGVAVAYYTDGVPAGLSSCVYGTLACLGDSRPSCVGALTFTSESGCRPFWQAVFLKVTFYYVYPECFPLGWGRSWPGPGVCQ